MNKQKWTDPAKLLIWLNAKDLNIRSQTELVDMFKVVDKRINEVEDAPKYVAEDYEAWLIPWYVLAGHFDVDHPVEFSDLIRANIEPKDDTQLGMFE